MKPGKEKLVRILKIKTLPLYFILIITILSLIGWVTGQAVLNAFSPKFIPIAPSSAVFLLILTTILFLNVNTNIKPVQKYSTFVITAFISIYCIFLILDFHFNFEWDLEKIFYKNPVLMGSVLKGRMSPITSLLFILCCVGILGIKQHNSIKIKYLGGSSALVVTIISSVLLIGYIYNAPLLYGSQIIPVAFPTAICFFIFSFSLLRLYKLPYWTFSLINEDPINLKLLKTFIPIIIFIVFFQGFLESTFFENRNNPTLTSAFILIIVIVITTTVILKVSSIISAQIKKVEKAEKTALKETMRLLEIADKSRQALLSVVEDEKKIKAEFIKLNETLEQRIEERTRMLEIANQELEAFSYSVSHDLRAPLRHISGYVEMLSKSLTDTIPEKTKHYLFTISDSAHQMGILIDDLLQFSRTGRQEMHQANLDMNFLLQNVLEIIQASPPSQNIEWSIADLPKVYGDPAMLRLVWLNLINNAVKYSSKKKKAIIEVGHYDENNESVFFVRDNGAGFDMKYASKLFGVFQRMHSSSEYEGTGIGLANVRRIILKHGGRVWAEAETGKGATFYFSLPKITKTNN